MSGSDGGRWRLEAKIDTEPGSTAQARADASGGRLGDSARTERLTATASTVYYHRPKGSTNDSTFPRPNGLRVNAPYQVQALLNN